MQKFSQQVKIWGVRNCQEDTAQDGKQIVSDSLSAVHFQRP